MVISFYNLFLIFPHAICGLFPQNHQILAQPQDYRRVIRGYLGKEQKIIEPRKHGQHKMYDEQEHYTSIGREHLRDAERKACEIGAKEPISNEKTGAGCPIGIETSISKIANIFSETEPQHRKYDVFSRVGISEEKEAEKETVGTVPNFKHQPLILYIFIRYIIGLPVSIVLYLFHQDQSINHRVFTWILSKCREITEGQT